MPHKDPEWLRPISELVPRAAQSVRPFDVIGFLRGGSTAAYGANPTVSALVGSGVGVVCEKESMCEFFVRVCVKCARVCDSE